MSGKQGIEMDTDARREQVRARYAAAATQATGCCDGDGGGRHPANVLPLEERDRFGASRYTMGLADLPVTAVSASLGCGDPTTVAELQPGEIVLDLGSGAGLDVLLSARRVGPSGHAYGLDMTEEMLDLARANAASDGADNVTFLAGEIEAIPLPDGAVDVVLSNCVINLSTDKAAVFRELSRVVRSGGRIAISDVVADDDLDVDERARRGSWVGCVSGALSFAEYRAGLAAVGFVDIEVEPTHEVTDGMSAAVIRGRRR
jgi:arsenite methyltransferase